MNAHEFLDLAVALLSVAIITILLFKRAGLGSLLGLLVAGMIVGPHSPINLIENVSVVRDFTELGVVFLMFAIGLEMQPQRLWRMRRAVFGLGTLQVLVTGVVLSLFALSFARDFPTAILIGLTLALSSTAFVLQLLQERNELNTRQGNLGFSILLLQDLAVVPMLAIMPLLVEGSEGHLLEKGGLEILFLMGIVLAGRYLIPFILQISARQRSADAFLLVVLLAVFGGAAASAHSNASMALGAFMMGMLLSTSRYHYQIEALVEPYKGLLMAMFFVAVGMSIDLKAVQAEWLYFITSVSLILALKAAVIFGLCLLFGQTRTIALKVALLLAQSGEFGFVLFTAAHNSQLISDHTFAMMIATVSLSMLATPLLVKLSDSLTHQKKSATPIPKLPSGKDHVIVIGYGRVGRTVCTMLKKFNIQYLVLESDLERVALGKQEGRSVFFGDATNIKLLEAAHVRDARLAVVAVHNVHNEKRVVSHLRTLNPELPIIARAWDLSSRDRLLKMGILEALPISIEGSLQMGVVVLKQLGHNEVEINQLVTTLREDYALIRRPAEKAK